MFDKVKEFLVKPGASWTIIAYLITFAIVYGMIWAIAEPMGIPDEFENPPNFLKFRLAFHLALSFVITPHLLVLFFLIYKFPADGRVRGLDKLGIVRVYKTATEDNDYFDDHLRNARKIQILAVNVEMLLRNRPVAIKEALKQGAEIQVLIATKDSELVKEMEAIEIGDGRDPNSRSIPKCIDESRGELISLYKEVTKELPTLSHGRVGKIMLGHFNTHYRESMIICDQNWVWWTPHLNPARGADRPTFVAEGADSQFVRLCVRHFEAVKRVSNPELLVA